MKVNFDVKKGISNAKQTVQKVGEAGKKAAQSVQTGIQTASNKRKDSQYQSRMKKYNPLFQEQFFSEDFHLPNMIMIVDDAVRKGVDVCEGAIGWLNNDNDVEILCLYDEAVALSGINFVPAAICDSMYYVDRFDRGKFITLDSLFDKAQEEKLAELQYIAQCLGAKKFSVEITETTDEKSIRKKEGKLTVDGNVNPASDVSVGSSVEHQKMSVQSAKRSATGVITFSGSNNPVVPELKWFSKDDTIRRLVEMRCSPSIENKVNDVLITLDGSASSTISKKTALAIDMAVSKVGVKGKSTFVNEVVKESRTKMILSINF